MTSPLLPISIINYIISYITEETPTSILIKKYNMDIFNNLTCFMCKKEIEKKIYLTCSNNHNNCWKCLKKKLKVSDVSCYGCPYKFRCLYDEISHVKNEI